MTGLILARLQLFAGTLAGRCTMLVLGVVLLYLAGYAMGHHSGKVGEVRAEAARLADQRTKNAGAQATAAMQRAKDTQAADHTQETLSHADDAQPDSRPSAARLALACERLRAQHAGRLPAECGPDR